jgi:Protein of unknown function (DUF2924)
VTALETLPITKLRRLWHETFGVEASLAARREFLIGNLGYQYQAKAHGGLGVRMVKELEAIAGGAKPKRQAVLVIKQGTKLIRMWKGEPHEVTVLGARQYQYKGQPYPSLSAIAGKVTGTKWNGKVFFGIKKAIPHG